MYFLKFSIHTPHAGSDTGAINKTGLRLFFNPHSPCGERHDNKIRGFEAERFSIHTPHAGSDTGSILARLDGECFQSTLPMRGATAVSFSIFSPPVFSIHTPHAGSDPIFIMTWRTEYFSIHTPHAGSDGCSGCPKSPAPNFNPHSPCGERLVTPYVQMVVRNFNPHSPCRERPVLFLHKHSQSCISIHTPHAGSDGLRNELGAYRWDISIHTPHAGSDTLSRYTSPLISISIHTPHAGSDFCLDGTVDCALVFQSTLPMRGATCPAP